MASTREARPDGLRRPPSWGHCPDNFTWRAASWGDRARALLVVLAVLGIFLAGTVRL